MGVVRVRWLIFSFGTGNHISGTAEARVAKFCMQVEYIKYSPLRETQKTGHDPNGRG